MDIETVLIKDILLVEDDPEDAQLTLAGLEEHDLASRVVVVHDGEKALDYLYGRGIFAMRPGGNPILVLLDLKMPKVNGLEVLRTIKADEQLRIIPVVVLSSSREARDVVGCYRYGANAYVVKPVDFGEFMKAVTQLGSFWTAVNEPPPVAWKGATGVQNGPAALPGKRKVEHKPPAPHPASGG
jgi:CheY-like chemotaxis protein